MSSMKMTILVATLAALFSASIVKAIPVNNGVVGEPEIECGTDAVTARVNTQNPFEGHVYVKGHYSEPHCRSDATNGYDASIKINFGDCNMKRQKTLNPPGLFVSITVVVTFHPKFLTKVDRAYDVRCFYMEADKTVTTNIEVSPLTTQPKQSNVPMPVCRYEVLRNGQFGQSVRYAEVGEKVYHKWTCDTETIDIFCMRVHSCSVDDGQGSKVELLNDKGCALDQYLLQNLIYHEDLSAGQDSHVFKYADRPNLYFQCQIAIYLKENGICERPYCYNNTARTRARRSGDQSLLFAEPEFQVDVATEPMSVLELDDSMADLPQSVNPNYDVTHGVFGRGLNDKQNSLCFASSTLLGAGCALVFVILCTVFTVFVLYSKRVQFIRNAVAQETSHDKILNGYSLKK